MIASLFLVAAITIGFLEEHMVMSGTPQTFGAKYVVPQGKRATVTGFFCHVSLRQSQAGQNNIEVSIVAQSAVTVRGPATLWLGTNPIACANGPGRPTAMSSGASLRLMPGDSLWAFYTNMSGESAFVMAGAWIVEESDGN